MHLLIEAGTNLAHRDSHYVCRDLSDKPHVKNVLMQLIMTVLHLNEPLCTLGDKPVNS